MVAGVFDSGIGGLTVLKSLAEARLFEKIIYFGDTARVPYGVKDKNTIIRYSLEALEFFQNFDIDIFIVACNTASAYAIKELREVSNIPVVGVIESGVLALNQIDISKNSNILIIGTKATINSNRYVNLLNKNGFFNITSKATALFVPLVEEGIFNGAILDETLNHYFSDLKKPDVVILGCTHFPLISKEINNYFGGVKLIHSGEAIVKYLNKNYIKNPILFEKTKLEFFASENPSGLKEVANRWLFWYNFTLKY